MARVPTVAFMKANLDFHAVHEEHAVTIMRQAMLYAETKRVGASLRRYCDGLTTASREWISEEILKEHNRSDRIRLALEIMNHVFESCGVEYLREDNDVFCERGAEYLNTGDTYAATILYDRVNGTWRVVSWGDFVEACERRGRKFI